jgi:hypothetical protein
MNSPRFSFYSLNALVVVVCYLPPVYISAAQQPEPRQEREQQVRSVTAVETRIEKTNTDTETARASEQNDQPKEKVGGESKLDMVEFQKRWDALDMPVHRGTGELTKSNERLMFDIGDVRTGSTEKLVMSIESKIASTLKLHTIPSCSCTLGFPDLVELKPNEPWIVQCLVKVPPVAQQFASTVRCFDQDIDFGFDVIIVGTAIGNVSIQPKELLVPTTDSNQTVLLSPNFPTIKPVDVDVISGPVKLTKVDVTEGNSQRIDFRVSPPPDPFESTGEVVFRYRPGEGLEYQTVKLVLSYEGRLKVSPPRVVFRKNSDGGFVAALMVSSGGVDWTKLDEKSLSASIHPNAKVPDEFSECKIARIVPRGDGVVVFISNDQPERFGQSASVRLKLGSDLSVEIPLTVLE